MGINLVKNIFYKGNVIIIKLLKDIGTNEKCRILNPRNYFIYRDCKRYSLAKHVVELRLLEYRTIVFYLNINLKEKDKIELSFKLNNKVISRKDLYNNLSTRIYRIKELEAINIDNSFRSIVDEENIKLEYKGDSPIDRILLRDFYVEVEDSIYYPISFNIEEKGVLNLTFTRGLFARRDEGVTLKVCDNPLSQDITGQSILGNIQLILRNSTTKIQGVSIVSKDSEKISLRTTFTENLLKFYKEDFSVYINNEEVSINNVIEMKKESIVGEIKEIESVIFEITSYIDDNIIMKENLINIKSKNNIEDVKTIDVNNIKVFDSKGKYADIMTAISLDVSLYNKTIAGSSFQVKFNKAVNKNSILNNLLEDSYLIAPGGIAFNEEEDKVIVDFKDAKVLLGNFILMKKDNNKFIIDENFKINNKPVILTYKKEMIKIEFNKEENPIGTLISISKVVYVPYSEIISTEYIYVYNSYLPIYEIDIQDDIIVKPGENPFSNGGIFNGNFVLMVNGNSSGMIYGGDIETSVKGNIEVMGENDIIFPIKVVFKNLLSSGEIRVYKDINVEMIQGATSELIIV